MPYERIVRALNVRRDIIDYYNLPLRAVITDEQLEDYIKAKAGIMDFGLKWLVETIRKDRFLPLLNFENGYLINERYPKKIEEKLEDPAKTQGLFTFL